MLVTSAALTLCALAAAHAAPAASGGALDAGSAALNGNGCPVDWDVHKLLPHADCDKFYYCVFGELVERSCAPGTYFNYDIQVCDWPENVNCAGSNADQEPDTENSSTGNSDGEDENGSDNGNGPDNDESGNDTDDAGAWQENGCPTDWDVHHLLPHESRCDRFYYCVHGNLVQSSCPTGTSFNPTLQVCDWPENVDCTNSDLSAEDNSDNDGDSDVDVAEWLENGCPSNWDIHHLLPHETECSKYYICVHGNVVERECSSGTHFNPTLHVCDWPQNAGCANNDAGQESNENENNGDSHPIGIVTPSPVTESSEEQTTTPSQSTEESDKVESHPIGIVTPFPVAESSSQEDSKASEQSTEESDNGGSFPIGIVTPFPVKESSEEENNGGVLDNGCPADFNVHQLLPHESSCGRFYSCANGQLVEQQCPTGTYFNPDIQVCDWPENVDCTNSASSAEDNSDNDGDSEVDVPEWLENGCPSNWDIHHLLPHETECSKYYICVHGNVVERECSSGTHFNPTLHVCDWPQNAGCANNDVGQESNENDSNADSHPIGIVTPSPVTESSEEQTTTPTQSTEESDNEASHPIGIVTPFPKPESSEEQSTTPTQSAEESDNEASHPISVVTPFPVTESSSQEDSKASEQSTEESDNGGSFPIGIVTPFPVKESSEEENNGGVLDNGCPADFNVHQLLPHESSCSRFYSCANGQLVEQRCPTGTYFNADIQACDWAANVACEHVSEEETAVEAEESEEATGEWLDNGCPSDWNVHQLLPHGSDCSRFYYCVHGQLVERECAPGTHFNAALQVCDWPASAGCAVEIDDGKGEPDNGNSDQTDSASEDNNGSGDETDNSTEANGGDSAQTDIGTEDSNGNDNETDNVTEDGNDGHDSEDDQDGHVPVVESDEWLDNGCPADWSVDAFLPHGSDCGKYYQCVHGYLVERQCPSGLHFNREIQTCDWPEHAGCDGLEEGSGSGDSVSIEASEENDNGDIEADSNDSEDNNDDDDTDNASEDNETDSIDGDASVTVPDCTNACTARHWSHETDCDKFWRCDNGAAVLGVCSEGLHFNAKTQTCDFMCNVNCERSNHIEATVTDDGLKLFVPWNKVDDRLSFIYTNGLAHNA